MSLLALIFAAFFLPFVLDNAASVAAAETSIAVISQPCRQPEVLVPAAAFAFLVPNVPDVSSTPF